MTRDELNEVLSKISIIEGRTFTTTEGDAWHEVLRGRTLPDALVATTRFYSKPFTHRAYPGDLNALAEDIENDRVQSVGLIELNEGDWVAADDPGQALRSLYQLVKKGRLTAESYSAYRRSELSINRFMADQEVSGGG